MSFRQFGGLQFGSKHNAVASYYNTSSNLIVTKNVGQPNSYINFLSDISGNQIFGNVDVSGNLNVSGDIDCSGNVTASEIFLTAPFHSYESNEVVPKSYVDTVGSGLIPYGRVKAISTYDSSGNIPGMYPVPINTDILTTPPFLIDGVSIYVGDNVLLNDQGTNYGQNPSANNGVYTYNSLGGTSYQFQRSTTIFPSGADSKAAYITVAEGTVNSLSGWVQTNDESPNTVGTTPLIFSNFFSFAFKLGQGLYPTQQDGQIYINVDSSLNFINYIDGSNNDTINIGTNTDTINIGKVSAGNNKMCIKTSVGINNNNPSPSYVLDVSGNTNVSGNGIFSGSVGVNGTSIATSGYLSINTGNTGNAINAPDTDTSKGNGLIITSAKSGLTTYSMGLGVDYATGNGFISCAGNSDFTSLLLNPRGNGGKVGIGTTSPASTLDVNGNLNTTMDASINSITIGRGGGNVSSNTAAGYRALYSNTTSGTNNTALGYQALYLNTNSFNTAVGFNALYSNTIGYYNNALGYQALSSNTDGIGNNAFGLAALNYCLGSNNSAFGDHAGIDCKTGDYNTFLGGFSTFDLSSNTFQKSTAIGYQATINASNQIVLGTSNEKVKIPGSYVGIGGVYNPSSGFALDVYGNTNVSGISYFNTKQFPSWPPSYPSPSEICNNAPIQIRSFYHTSDKLILTSDPSNNTAGIIQYVWDNGDTFSSNQGNQLQLNPYGGCVFINKLSSDYSTNSYALDVSGSVIATGGSQSFIAFENAGSFYGMGTINSALCFSANRPLNSNTPQMVLTSDGNVGIGTYAPGYKLDVTGDINSSGTIYSGGSTSGLLLQGDGTNSFVRAKIGTLYLGGGDINTMTIDNTTVYIGNLKMYTSGSDSVIKNNNTGNLYLWGNGNSGIRIDGSGIVNAAGFNTQSDYRIKENVTQLDSKFVVDNLNPVTYLNTKTDKQDIGLIAHELQEIYPELVNGEKDGEQFQSVNYIGLIPILIKEIQELKKEIKLVKTELHEVKNK